MFCLEYTVALAPARMKDPVIVCFVYVEPNLVFVASPVVIITVVVVLTT